MLDDNAGLRDRILDTVYARIPVVGAQLQASATNGMTMCQGNVALMTDDLPAAIRRFGEAGRVKGRTPHDGAQTANRCAPFRAISRAVRAASCDLRAIRAC